jgi:hypothetical protein
VQVRVKNVGMGRVWVCMLLYYSQIYSTVIWSRQKTDTRSGGVEKRKKPKDLSAHERTDA